MSSGLPTFSSENLRIDQPRNVNSELDVRYQAGDDDDDVNPFLFRSVLSLVQARIPGSVCMGQLLTATWFQKNSMTTRRENPMPY